jgi:hypothetical protein
MSDMINNSTDMGDCNYATVKTWDFSRYNFQRSTVLSLVRSLITEPCPSLEGAEPYHKALYSHSWRGSCSLLGAFLRRPSVRRYT